MSADNGIYVLKTKDSYRVVHKQAIEDLYWSPVLHYSKSIVPTRAVQIFGRVNFTRDFSTAMKIATAMESRIGTEYGIRTFTINKSWRQVVDDAKKLAAREIDYMERFGDKWKRTIDDLNELLGQYK